MKTQSVPLALLADGTPMGGLADVVRARGATSPAAVAVSGEGPDVSYSELDERLCRVASGLVAAGLGPGDRSPTSGPTRAGCSRFSTARPGPAPSRSR